MKYLFCVFILCYSAFAEIYVSVKGAETVKMERLLQLAGYDATGLGKLWTQKITFKDNEEAQDFRDRIIEYYQSIGYYKVSIDENWTSDSDVIFSISEGKPIRVTDIKYITPAPLETFVPFHIGDVFTTDGFTQSKFNIKRNLNETGYPTAVFEAKAVIDLSEYTCTLVYQVSNYVKSYFGKINVIANGWVSEDSVKDHLAFKEGEAFDVRKIEQSRQALYNANIFGNVLIAARPKGETHIPTDINLTKGRARSWGGSLGYDTDEGYIGKLYWENRNFSGDMDVVKTMLVKTAVRDYAGVDYSVQSAYGLLSETLFGESVNYPGFRQNHVENYPKLTFPIGITTHQLGFKTDDGYVVPSNPSQYILAQNYFINAPTYKYTLDKRNSKIDATNGYLFGFYSEITGQVLGSSMRYLKLVGEGSFIKNPFNDLILFARYKVGMIDDYRAGAVPVFERFFAGGVNSNRGYHWRMLGPTDGYGNPTGGQSIVDASLETRLQTIKDLWVVAFWDTTQLNYQSLHFNQAYKNSVGLGVRYTTPIGPIRLDIGVPLNETSHYPVLNIAFGQQF